MKVDISPLLDQPDRPLTETAEWPATEVDLDSDSFSVNQPINVDFTLVNDGGTIIATGTYESRLTLLCGRCLTDYEESLTGELEARYLSSEDVLRREKEQAEEAVYFGLIRDNEVDLTSVVRQDILVQCPMRPLCKDDCEGLCPVCGTNLNEDDCGHEQEKGDPRLSEFRELADEFDDSDD